MNFTQQAVVFSCKQESLVAILTRPQSPHPRGVLIVVGGPQYRVGSHRQFVLLANRLAQEGIPVMRFDYTGMGDSTGGAKTFEHIDHDIGRAIDTFFSAFETLREVVIWGLCDAASAALFYAHKDPRVTGVVLLNPWVRTMGGQARTYLKHYYLQKLFSFEYWARVFRGEFHIRESGVSLIDNVRQALKISVPNLVEKAPEELEATSLPLRMAECLERFHGLVLLILSGNDLTAKEFVDAARASKKWVRLIDDSRVTQYKLDDATHTFSSRRWRDQVALWTIQWLGSK